MRILKQIFIITICFLAISNQFQRCTKKHKITVKKINKNDRN